eukprot:CAMPEP_0168425066 /NCGR_PEP_ID=MMETSP0228-20121227/35138_1 /TAXON_ID=133427 /ORGANISM="Protoceratium reticulatum, Strain CCCM 535 (=CCMP 1889)" /LENGTH=187 /DNA_ID=CAMNT_0008439059 /DNA_START=1 /DNA_END=560 /DNA_ORIENTATION=-
MIMVEITSNMRLMLPLMLCIMISKAVADRFESSVFNIALELNKDIRMLHGELPGGIPNTEVIDYCSREVVVLRCQEKTKTIKKILEKTTYHGFPVVEGEGQTPQVLGMITRSKLLCAVADTSRQDLDAQAPVDLVPYADIAPEVKHWKTPVSRVLSHFVSMGLQYLLIVDHDHALVGMVTRTDLFRL